MRRRDSDRGAVVLEVLVLAPAFFLLIDLALFAGTTAILHSVAHRAAETAAREGSMVRNGADAGQGPAAGKVVAGSQGFVDTVCTGSAVDPNPWKVPVGEKAEFTYSATCTAQVLGVTFPGIPTQVTYTVTATSVLDPYRWRAPDPGAGP